MLVLLVAAALAEPVTCRAWVDQPGVVAIDDAPLTEISGLTAGRDDEEVVWALEDAGHDAVLHLFRLDGLYLGEQVVEGATNIDWEDLASGPCPEDHGASCLWIADIGDNDDARLDRTLWIVPESLDDRVAPLECTLSWADGNGRDAEALLVHPDGTVRVVTKEGDGGAHVYVGDGDDCAGGAIVVAEEAEIAVAEPVTGGVVSPDGSMVVLRSRSLAWAWPACTLRWDRAPEERALLDEPQGEAVGWMPDGRLLTAGEADDFAVHVYACDDGGDPCEGGCGCAIAPPSGWAGSAGGLAALVLSLARRRGPRGGSRAPGTSPAPR
jgi:hypothetical protein